MAALSERKLEIVQGMVEAAPDAVIDALGQALADAAGDTALASVRRLVEAEARDRQFRNLVFQPLAPLCVGDGRDLLRLTFPAPVLGLLWRGLKSAAPVLVRNALVAGDHRPGEPGGEALDRLVRLTAKEMRAGRTPQLQTAAKLCDEARAGGAEALLTCLDLSPGVRRALPRLSEWTTQKPDAAIAARLAYKDASAVSDEAGVRFFQMLSAHLPQDWTILRIISAVMDKPTERFLAGTELGVFGERLLRDLEDGLRGVDDLDPDAGADAALDHARIVERMTQQANEIETFVALSRDQGWGQAVVRHRKSLAASVEARFRDAERALAKALPAGRAKLQRIRRSVPAVDAPPDPAAVRRCTALLTFVHELRNSASHGGFAASRSKLTDTLGEQIDHYVDELLDLLKTGDVPDGPNPRAYLALAADFSALVRDEKAADLVRRRTATALGPPAPAARAAVA